MKRLLQSILSSQSSLRLAILFGSLANGNDRPDSDVDIAILADEPLSANIKQKLIAAIADETGRPVDLIDIRTAGEPLLGEIFKGQRILGSDDTYAEWLCRHLLDTADFLPLQQRILKERRAAWIS